MARLVSLLLLSAVAHTAAAHEGHAESFLSAFAHPFAGWDHVLAALLVGMLAARVAGARAVELPAAFAGGTAAGLAFGAALGLGSAPGAWLEPALATTVVLLGLTVAVARAVPVGATLVCLLLGLVHGSAHGGEVQGSAAAIAGLIAATITLHAAGYALAGAAGGRAAWLARSGGAAAALVGLVVLGAMAPLA